MTTDLKTRAHQFLIRARTEVNFTNKEAGEIAELIAALYELNDDGAHDAADALTDEFPGAKNYDINGNWIGAEDYPDGWTA